MNFENLWPTVIGSGEFEVPGLLDYILINYDLNNLQSETDGGNLFDNQDKAIQDFKAIAYSKFDEYMISTIGKSIKDFDDYSMRSWITNNNPYSMPIHNHRGSHLSAVFYVLAGANELGGEIIFSDPRTNANRGYDPAFNVLFKQKVYAPKSGEFKIFPSFTYHQ